MKNRRSIFATDYIEETVLNLAFLVNNNGSNKEADQELLKWACDVLKVYFNNVSSHTAIDKARKEYQSIRIPTLSNSCKTEDQWSPYPRKDIQSIQVPTFDEFFHLASKRRSVRWYKEKKVPRDIIEKAISIATLSPSACNRQPFFYRVIDDEDFKNEVGSIPMGIRPFYKNIPVFVVLVGQLSAYRGEQDRHVIYIDGGLTAMSFMLALETLGLSSVPINWPDIEKFERKMEKVLKLENDERPILIMGIGYSDPEGLIPYSKKKSPQVLIKYN